MKRYLRPSIEKFLTVVFAIIGIFLVMLDDFTPDLKTISILASLVLTEVVLFNILSRYGRIFNK